MSRAPRAALQRLRFRVWRANKLRLWRMTHDRNIAPERIDYNDAKAIATPEAVRCARRVTVDGQDMSLALWQRRIAAQYRMAGPKGVLP